MPQPIKQVVVLSAMILVADGRRHVDDSLDELGFLEIGHGLVPAQEFVASQPITALQRRDRSRSGEGGGDVSGTWFAQLQFSKPGFDGDLPATRHAKQLPVARVLNQGLCGRTQ
jgi:hypothetical protein